MDGLSNGADGKPAPLADCDESGFTFDPFSRVSLAEYHVSEFTLDLLSGDWNEPQLSEVLDSELIVGPFGCFGGGDGDTCGKKAPRSESDDCEVKPVILEEFWPEIKDIAGWKTIWQL